MEEQGYETAGELMEQLDLPMSKAVQDSRKETLERLDEPGMRLNQDPELLRAYLRRYPQDHWVRAAIRRVCLDLNSAFDKAHDNELLVEDTRDVAERSIRDALYPAANFPNTTEPGKAVIQHARAIIAGLRSVRYLEDLPDRHVRRRCVFNAGYLINSLLGFPLYIDGLAARGEKPARV